MAETAVLSDLAFDALPQWIDRLRKYIPPESTANKVITPATLSVSPQGIDGLTAEVGSEAQKTPPITPPGPLNDLKAFVPLTQTHGMSKLESKPDNSKSRFSSITGPIIYYDGEKQAMLNGLWNMVNSKRGLLRREMMQLKRRQQFAAVAAQISSDESSDGEGGGAKGDDESDEAAELLRMKMQLQREKMLRMTRTRGPMPMANFDTLSSGGAQKRKVASSSLAPQSDPDDDAKLKTLLEVIDDNLDKTNKVCETAAFIWLKGDSASAHLKFIIGRFGDTITRIEQSGLIKPKEDMKQGGKPLPAWREKPPQIQREEMDIAVPALTSVDVTVAVTAPVAISVDGKDAEMKDDSVLEVASSCVDNMEASSIDTAENPKMAAAKRRMREAAAKLEARQHLRSATGGHWNNSPPQVDVLS